MDAAAYAPEMDEERVDEACRSLGIRLLLLFGSRATGRPAPTADSDLDLAVVFRKGRPLPSLPEALEALASAFPGEDVDVVLLHDADPLLRWEVLRDGVLLRGDPLDHLEYRAFAYRDFMDSEDLRKLERRLSEKKVARVRERLRASP